jgi:carbonic anhydrase/acetyltransferase-like protein (isoleucine patch superfamily)
VILDEVELGPQCLVGACALVTQRTKIPGGSLVLGSPAKVVRPLTPEELASLKYSAEKYADTAAYCLAHKINLGEPL